MSLEVFEKLEAKVQQAIDTITLLQMEIEELKEKNNSLSQEVQSAQQQREELERENNNLKEQQKRLAGSSACPVGAYGRSLILVIFHVMAALAAYIHPSHIVAYAPGDSLTCRLALTRNL
ncbi:Cell division protein zapB [Citrobacter braakii]|nr:Cell division protein zapB [Citrobacter braakii]